MKTNCHNCLLSLKITKEKLNSSKIKKVFNWKPKWNIDTAIEKTVEWAKNYKDNNDMVICTDKQIEEFFNI